MGEMAETLHSASHPAEPMGPRPRALRPAGLPARLPLGLRASGSLQLLHGHPCPCAWHGPEGRPLWAQVIKLRLRQRIADSRCARKSRGRAVPVAAGWSPVPAPETPRRSLPHRRPEPIPLRSPRPGPNPALRRQRELDREPDREELPGRNLGPSLDPSARLCSLQSTGMCPGPASYSKGPSAPGPQAWEVARQRASGRRQPPTLAGGLGCLALNASLSSGSCRKVKQIFGGARGR